MSKVDQGAAAPKEAMESARFKVIVRHLPPSLSSELFQKAIEGFVDGVSWMNYEKGRTRKEGVVYSVAYLAFSSEEKLYAFYDKFQGHSFIDQKGVEYLAQVEYAPHQKVPKPCNQDKYQNTIENDPSYQSFLEQLKKPIELLPSAEIQIDRQDISVIETNKGPILSPLILDLRRKREQRLLAKNSGLGDGMKIITRDRGKDTEDGSNEVIKKYTQKKASENSRKAEKARKKKEKEEAERSEQAKNTNAGNEDNLSGKKTKPRKGESKTQSDMTIVFKVKETAAETTPLSDAREGMSTPNTPSSSTISDSPSTSQETVQTMDREKRKDTRPDQQLWTRKSLQKALEPGVVRIQKKAEAAQLAVGAEATTDITTPNPHKAAQSKPMPDVSIKLNPPQLPSERQTQEKSTSASSDTQPRSYEKGYSGSNSHRKGAAQVQYVVKTKPAAS